MAEAVWQGIAKDTVREARGMGEDTGTDSVELSQTL